MSPRAARATVRSPASAVLTGVYSGVAGIRLSRSSAARSALSIPSKRSGAVIERDLSRPPRTCWRIDSSSSCAMSTAENASGRAFASSSALTAPPLAARPNTSLRTVSTSAVRRFGAWAFGASTSGPAIAVSARRAAGRRASASSAPGTTAAAASASGERARASSASGCRIPARFASAQAAAWRVRLVRSSAGSPKAVRSAPAKGCGRVGRRRGGRRRCFGRTGVLGLRKQHRRCRCRCDRCRRVRRLRRTRIRRGGARWRRLRFHHDRGRHGRRLRGRCLRDLHRRIRRPRDRRRLMRGGATSAWAIWIDTTIGCPPLGTASGAPWVPANSLTRPASGSPSAEKQGRTQRAATPAAHAGGAVGWTERRWCIVVSDCCPRGVLLLTRSRRLSVRRRTSSHVARPGRECPAMRTRLTAGCGSPDRAMHAIRCSWGRSRVPGSRFVPRSPIRRSPRTSAPRQRTRAFQLRVRDAGRLHAHGVAAIRPGLGREVHAPARAGQRFGTLRTVRGAVPRGGATVGRCRVRTGRERHGRRMRRLPLFRDGMGSGPRRGFRFDRERDGRHRGYLGRGRRRRDLRRRHGR